MSQPTSPQAQPPRQPHQGWAGSAQPWLAAVAIVPILATVYQTLVLTDVTDDVIRKGIEAEHYAMIWPQVCWGIGMIYGVFAGIWVMPRRGNRDTLLLGLALFLLGNVLCGSALDVPTMAAAKLVEGVGKGMVILICRSVLFQQFDRMLIVAIGIYGVIAYSTRPTTPLLTSLINDALSWRWIYWVNVPLALLAFPLVLRFVRPDRPSQPRPLRIDWVAIALLTVWSVSLLFTFAWYRKWGGWTSNAFTATALLALLLPAMLAVRVGSGLPVDEHLRRMFRVRGYVLAMCTRMLLLIQLLMVLSLLGKYCVDVREYPRSVAGWALAPATLTMAASTFLTTFFHRRRLRHFWLLVGVVGCAACLWWMGSLDSFTSKRQIALMIGCWGLFVGLIPPSFLQDEVEGLQPHDFMYGGALAVIALIVPFVVIPSMTSTIIAEWTDRSADMERLNVRENRPEVQESSVRIADYFHQRGIEGPELAQMTSTVLGSFVRSEAAVQGIQRGLQFLSLLVGGSGVLVVALLVWAQSVPLPAHNVREN
ncbi:MAG: MFS transporter [Thermoguttaceae bacterium]